MNIKTIRKSLAATLTVLAAVAVVFYLRQNAGLQTGGEISLPKMLWLAWAIAAWFVVPVFLWRDARLTPDVRRLFGVFWGVMMVRGMVEMVLIYGFGHWHPLYGITHDVLCLVLVLVLRRGLAGGDAPNRHALAFSTTLAVSLTAETAFAGMFLQTGAHAEQVYFASSAAGWGFVNLVTLVVLCFLVPDLAAALTGLYFPGRGHQAPRALRRVRAVLATLTALAALAALGFWTWMARLETEADRYARVGFEIYDSCGRFAADFQLGDEDGMADFVTGGDATWEAVADEHGHRFANWKWREGGPERGLLETLVAWRRDMDEVLQAAFKIHLIDEVVSESEAVVQLRFEVTGRHASDYGLIRGRFRRGGDGRWRIAESSLVEGRSVSGPGDHFVDAAARRGLDFVATNDRRFTPDDPCASAAECEGPRVIKFETMRHAYAGAATADYDGDGQDDVFLCAGGRPALYRNRGDGHFEDVTAEHPFKDLWHVNAAGFADLDNDGDQDLLLGAFYGPNHLFENRGAGADGTVTFTDASADSGLADLDMLTVFSFFDYDNDGDLDLYLGRYLDARTEIPDSFLYARNGMPDRLYRNEGGLEFRDVSEEAGVGDVGLALAVAAADYDGDGDQDLYLANDFGRNVLYQNQGPGTDGVVTFRDVALETGSLAVGGSMSASWGDYDNDGLLDLYVSAIRSNQRWFVQPLTARRVMLKFLREGRLGSSNPLFSDLRHYMGDEWMEIGNYALAGNYLLRQREDGTFVDEAPTAGARPAGWYWSSAFLDIDHDGDLDVYATDGWITGRSTYDL